jgi:hypothetical protein
MKSDRHLELRKIIFKYLDNNSLLTMDYDYKWGNNTRQMGDSKAK